MLDINHPETKITFEAANYEDSFLDIAKKMTTSSTKKRKELMEDAKAVLKKTRVFASKYAPRKTKALIVISEIEKSLEILADQKDVNGNYFLREPQEFCPFCNKRFFEYIQEMGDPANPTLHRDVYCSDCLDDFMKPVEAYRKMFGTDFI